MCAAACVWAGLSEIVFGTSTQDLIEAGTEQIEISCQQVVNQGFQNINVVSGILATDCLELFK